MTIRFYHLEKGLFYLRPDKVNSAWIKNVKMDSKNIGKHVIVKKGIYKFNGKFFRKRKMLRDVVVLCENIYEQQKISTSKHQVTEWEKNTVRTHNTEK